MQYPINSEQYISLRKWLVAQRHKSGLSTRALSEKLNVTHSIVSKIELGSRKLDVFEFIDYCQGLGLDPQEGFNVLLKIMNKNRSLNSKI